MPLKPYCFQRVKRKKEQRKRKEYDIFVFPLANINKIVLKWWSLNKVLKSFKEQNNLNLKTYKGMIYIYKGKPYLPRNIKWTLNTNLIRRFILKLSFLEINSNVCYFLYMVIDDTIKNPTVDVDFIFLKPTRFRYSILPKRGCRWNWRLIEDFCFLFFVL